jgi:heme-degrading monooxygenase HmoA
MIAVIFEAVPVPGQKSVYLDAAAQLRPHLAKIDGFISIERFESLAQPGKILSLSFWQNEAAVANWRNLEAHRSVQSVARRKIFADYRICVANVVRDYGLNERIGAPEDSQDVHDN